MEMLALCLVIAMVWIAAIRGPGKDVTTSHDDADEEQRLWYGASLRNEIDRR
jgi:hypothetical protein